MFGNPTRRRGSAVSPTSDGIRARRDACQIKRLLTERSVKQHHAPYPGPGPGPGPAPIRAATNDYFNSRLVTDY